MNNQQLRPSDHLRDHVCEALPASGVIFLFTAAAHSMVSHPRMSSAFVQTFFEFGVVILAAVAANAWADKGGMSVWPSRARPVTRYVVAPALIAATVLLHQAGLSSVSPQRPAASLAAASAPSP